MVMSSEAAAAIAASLISGLTLKLNYSTPPAARKRPPSMFAAFLVFGYLSGKRGLGQELLSGWPEGQPEFYGPWRTFDHRASNSGSCSQTVL
jgi:hypothetical protein